MAHTELVDRRGIHLFKCRAASIHGKSVQILTQQPATTRRWRVSSNAITISLFPESPRHVFSMRKLRILRWMAGGRVPMCPRVSSQGACGTMQPRHGAELGGAQRCGSVGSTEVRTLPECRGTLRGAHRGRGTQRCSFLLFVNCSFTHFTHILRHWHCYGSFITSWSYFANFPEMSSDFVRMLQSFSMRFYQDMKVQASSIYRICVKISRWQLRSVCLISVCGAVHACNVTMVATKCITSLYITNDFICFIYCNRLIFPRLISIEIFYIYVYL